MTKNETVKLFAIIKALFPRDDAFKNATPDMVVAWAEMLADIPFDHAKAAVKAAVSTSPFPPAISEIRDYATRITGPRRMTAEEAWGAACEAMHTYGLRMVLKDGCTQPKKEPPARFGEPVRVQPVYVEYEAKRHLPPEVWAILERMGYADVYRSEAPDVVRGQFMRAWGLHDREATERRVLGGVLPEFVRMLGETMSLEGGKA